MYALGDRVLLDSFIKDENFRPINNRLITVHGKDPRGEEFTVDMKAIDGRPGAYEGEYYPVVKGEFTLWVEDPRRAKERQAEINFKAELPQLEYENPRMNEDLLQNISDSGGDGGQYFTVDRISEIPALIAPRKESVQRPDSVTLWDNWFPFLLFVLLITAEWILRKRQRMA